MFIGILLQFILPALVELLKYWLGKRGSFDGIENAKADYVASAQGWVFRAKRRELAAQLFDEVMEQMRYGVPTNERGIITLVHSASVRVEMRHQGTTEL